MKRKIIKNIIYTLSILVLGCIACIITCNSIINRSVAQGLYDDLAEIPDNEVGVLLGTSPKLKNGKNNLYFDHRISAAIQLYKAGKIKYILISGDNRQKNYNEPEYMKRALIQGGIPEGAIYLDYAGFRTLDSMVRAKKVFGQDRFTVISQKFHNARAVYIARKNGIEAIGFNARDVDAYSGFKTQIRERLARVKVFIDLFTRKQPKFLGEKIIIGNADTLNKHLN